MKLELLPLQELLLLGIIAREYSWGTIQREVKVELIRRGFNL